MIDQLPQMERNIMSDISSEAQAGAGQYAPTPEPSENAWALELTQVANATLSRSSKRERSKGQQTIYKMRSSKKRSLVVREVRDRCVLVSSKMSDLWQRSSDRFNERES